MQQPSTSYPTTFITAFLQLYTNGSSPISDTDRIRYFKTIVESGVPIVVYCSQCFLEMLRNIPCHDAVIFQVVELNELSVYQQLKSENITELPYQRNEKKDTFEYLCLMNSKTELVERTIQMNPFESTHYAWLDFNFFHIFYNNSRFSKQESILQNKIAFEWLASLKTRRMITSRSFLALPGCWNYNYDNPSAIVNELCWRFSGGYFVGTRDRVLEFCNVCKTFWLPFLQEYRTLTWEVNYWSWLELRRHLLPDWYHGDHDAAMLTPSNDYTSDSLMPRYSRKLDKQYPNIPKFRPTTISVCEWNGMQIMNTRFVNYEIMSDGCYYVKHPQYHLYTRNICSLMDGNSHMNTFCEMFESTGELEDHCDRIFGFEDLRLYVGANQGDLRFIATNLSHVPNGKSRILRGIYDMDNRMCRKLSMIHPPTNTDCEKNWIPLPQYSFASGSEAAGTKSGDGYDYFIYSWYPFQIGRIPENTDTSHYSLEIVVNLPNWTPRFDRVRGSSSFVDTADGWLGVVHLSEDHCPRHYYHMMVLLDKQTFIPKRYSRTFCFHQQSIEFCMAFSVIKSDMADVYCFWISNYDHDPEYLEVFSSELPLDYSFVFFQDDDK